MRTGIWASINRSNGSPYKVGARSRSPQLSMLILRPSMSAHAQRRSVVILVIIIKFYTVHTGTSGTMTFTLFGGQQST